MATTSTTAFNRQQPTKQRRDVRRNERRNERSVDQTNDRRLNWSEERGGSGITDNAHADAAPPGALRGAMTGVGRHRGPTAATSGVAGPAAYGGHLQPDTQDTRFWRGTLRYWSLPANSLQK